jgi:hypothetical protein
MNKKNLPKRDKNDKLEQVKKSYSKRYTFWFHNILRGFYIYNYVLLIVGLFTLKNQRKLYIFLVQHPTENKNDWNME